MMMWGKTSFARHIHRPYVKMAKIDMHREIFANGWGEGYTQIFLVVVVAKHPPTLFCSEH